MTILEKFSAFSVFLLSALCFQFDLKHQDVTASFKTSSPAKEGGWVENPVNRKKEQAFFLKICLPDGTFSDSFLLEPSGLSRQPESSLIFESLGKEAPAIPLPSINSLRKRQDFSSFHQRVGNVGGSFEPAGEALPSFHFSLDALVSAPLEALVEEDTSDDGEVRADAEESPLEQRPPKPLVEKPETLREMSVLAPADPVLAQKQIVAPADLEEMEVVADSKPPAAKLEEVEILKFAALAKKALAFSKLFVEEAEGLKAAHTLALEDPIIAQKQPVINLEGLEDIEFEFVSEPVVRGAPCAKAGHVKASEQNKLSALVAVPVEETPLLRKACLKSVEPKIFKKINTLLEKVDPRRFWAPSERPDKSKVSYYSDRGLTGLSSKTGM